MPCTIMLGFDVDAETLWTYRGSYTPTPVSRGQYDLYTGVPRILGLLSEYDIKATFFVPGWVVLRYKDVVKSIAGRGHELSHHGWLHHDPNSMPPEQEASEFSRGLDAFVKVLGSRPCGYRSPAFDLSPNTLGILKQHGYIYDSSMMASEKPYFIREQDGASAVVEVPVSWELDDAPYFLFNFAPSYRVGTSDPRVVEHIWKTEIECARAEGGYVNITMHPQIIGRRHRMAMLRRVIEFAVGLGDVRFATIEQVARDAASDPGTERMAYVPRWSDKLAEE